MASQHLSAGKGRWRLLKGTDLETRKNSSKKRKEGLALPGFSSFVFVLSCRSFFRETLLDSVLFLYIETLKETIPEESLPFPASLRGRKARRVIPSLPS